MSGKASTFHSVLVIDDHKMVIIGLRLSIGDLFEEFHHTKEGTAGIALAKQHQPQLVIVDNQLPDMPGDMVVREVKKHCPKTRILGYSFTMNSLSIHRMYEAGIHGYVDKSEADTELTKGINHLLEGKEYFSKEARLRMNLPN